MRGGTCRTWPGRAPTQCTQLPPGCRDTDSSPTTLPTHATQTSCQPITPCKSCTCEALSFSGQCGCAAHEMIAHALAGVEHARPCAGCRTGAGHREGGVLCRLEQDVAAWACAGVLQGDWICRHSAVSKTLLSQVGGCISRQGQVPFMYCTLITIHQHPPLGTALRSRVWKAGTRARPMQSPPSQLCHNRAGWLGAQTHRPPVGWAGEQRRRRALRAVTGA